MAGIGALLTFGGRSLKSQLKSANKAGIGIILILGEGELAAGAVVARDMQSSEQITVPLAEITQWLQERFR